MSVSYNSPTFFIFCPSPVIYHKNIPVHIILKWIISLTPPLWTNNSCLLYWHNNLRWQYFYKYPKFSLFSPSLLLFFTKHIILSHAVWKWIKILNWSYLVNLLSLQEMDKIRIILGYSRIMAPTDIVLLQ